MNVLITKAMPLLAVMALFDIGSRPNFVRARGGVSSGDSGGANIGGIIGGGVMIFIGFWIIVLIQSFIAPDTTWTLEQNNTYATLRTIAGALFIVVGATMILKTIKPAIRGF